jgi:hypothetical protein
VGVGYTGASTYLLFSRALILDGGGSPTTITILSDETLDVTYEFRMYPKETDNTGAVTFTGNIGGTYDWIIRPASIATVSINSGGYSYTNTPFNNVGWANGILSVTTSSIAAITTIPSGLSQTGTQTCASYVTSNYYVIHTFSWTLAQANLSPGIKCVTYSLGMIRYQLEFNPYVPKTANDVFNFKVKCTWGRV